MTGKEIEMGTVLVDLAKYARDKDNTEKLYLDDSKEMYIEISVQSKPIDVPPVKQPNRTLLPK